MKQTVSFALVLLTVAATTLAHGINTSVQTSGGKKNTNPDAAQLPLTGLAPRPVTALRAGRRLTYTVEPVIQEEKYRLRVSLTFRGDSSGKSRLLLPLEWDAGVRLYRAIKDLRPSAEGIKIEDTDEPHVKLVNHKPGQSVSLTYEVATQPPGTQITHAVYHHPVVTTNGCTGSAKASLNTTLLCCCYAPG